LEIVTFDERADAPQVDTKELHSDSHDIPEVGAPDLLVDSDDDGLLDQFELETGTDPHDFDTDDDGLGDGAEVDLGTDPLLEDTDTDGIGDWQETQDETDPLDPSSASAWHPEWNAYPRLVFGPESVAALKERAAAPPPMHEVMLQRVKSKASQEAAEPNPDSYDPYYEVSRAAIARAGAFMALIDNDAAMALKAFDITTTLNPHLDEVGFSSPLYSKTDIHAAEAIIYFCQAYDFVSGTQLLEKEQLEEMEESITSLVSTLEKEATTGPMMALLCMAQNNHNMKTYAAIGTAGITFNHRPEAARWVNRGITELNYYFFDFQTTADGGYAEGPSYLNYCLGDTLSFLNAYHRFALGRDFYFRNFFDTREVQEELFVWLGDPAQEEHLHNVFRWPVRIMMPGGLSPNIDDSQASTLASGYLAAFFDDPLFLWHWTLPALKLATGAGVDLAVDTFALLPPGMEPVPPDLEPDQFLYEAGNCVFRNSYEDDADTYVLLMGEHGKIRQHGQGHEHPDAFEVLLHARGEYLLLDAGYVNWEGKDSVCHAENHNIVLVDEKGPPDNELTGIGSDTFLSGFAVADGHKTCLSSTSYEGVDFSRRVVLTPDDVLVVLDSVQSDTQHDYTVLWHGNGGGTSGGGFQLQEHGAAWTRPGAALSAVCGATHLDVSVSGQEYPHSFSYGQELSHEALQCELTGESAQVLSLFAVRQDESDESLPPSLLESGEGVVLTEVGVGGDHLVAAAVSVGGGPVLVTTPCAIFETDAPLVLVRCSAEYELVELRRFGGTFATEQ